jgi:hypothetical protein
LGLRFLLFTLVLLIGVVPTLAQEQIALTTAGWPFVQVPTQEQIDSDPYWAVYNDMLQAWLAENPNVTIEQVDFNIWDPQGLVTGIAGGTAPSAWSATVLGSYSMPATRAAFAQGLSADVTDLYAEYDVDSMVADYIRAYNRNWIVDGQMYAAPVNFNPGNGVIYRRDLVRELGLEEPGPGWTWDQFQALALALTADGRRGAALPPWGMFWYLGSYGYTQTPDGLNAIPDLASGWNWRYDFMSDAEGMAQAVENYRTMLFTDQSIMTDVSMFDQQVEQALLDGTAAMGVLHAGFLRARAPGKFLDLARQEGVALEDKWGFAPFPRGTGPEIQQPFGDAIAFNPDLSPEALRAAFDLYVYMYMGEGYYNLQRGVYEATGDLTRVWEEFPTLTGITEIEGIPGGPVDAWGQTLVDEFSFAASRPIWPQPTDFLPAEGNPAPSLLALGDTVSRWTTTADGVDIMADIQTMQDNMNAEVAAFESSVSDEDFVAGISEFYATWDAFLQEHAPEFYANEWLPHFTEVLQPALGQ